MTSLHINDLPTELLMTIFHYLDLYETKAARLTCRLWSKIAKLIGVCKIDSCTLDINHDAATHILEHHINKLHMENVTLGDVDKLFKHLSASLTELSLNTMPVAKPIKLMIVHLSHLHTLKVSEIISLDLVEDFDTVPVGYLPELKVLELSKNLRRVDIYFLKCAQKSLALRRLKIACAARIEIDLIKLIRLQSTSIKELNLGQVDRSARPSDLRGLARAVIGLNLTELSLEGHFCNCILPNIIKTQTELRSLDMIDSSRVIDDHLAIIGEQLLDLTKIRLAYCPNVTTDGVMYLSKLGNLKSLSIKFCENVKALPDISNNAFKELCVGGIELEDEYFLTFIKTLPTLAALDLGDYETSLTDELLLKILQNQQNLDALSLSSCWELTDTVLLSMSLRMKRLKILNLEGCSQITDLGLRAVLKLPNLRMLNICFCKYMTNDGIQAIIDTPNRIADLYMSLERRISDASVSKLLFGMKSLRMLVVFHCKSKTIALPKNWLRSTYSCRYHAIKFRKQLVAY